MTAQLEMPVETGDTQVRRGSLRIAELGLAALGVIAAVLVALDPAGIVRAVIVLLALTLLPGWAVVRFFPRIEPAARLVFSFVGSVAVLTLVSLGMVWATAWHPRIAVVVVLLAAAAVVVVRPVARATRSGAPLLRPRRAYGARKPLPWIVLAVAAALWVVGLTMTNSTDLGDIGLLAAFPIWWYLSVAIAFGVIVAALFTRRRAPLLLPAASSLLIVILYMSANLVENAPRLPWVYKHIAVTAYIEANGSVDPSIDIYNRWPGFFSFSASLGTAIGYRNPVSYAAWAELAFALVDAALVLAIARTLSGNRRFAWTSVLVFSVGNWIGQNYYSPQAFAFMLYLTATLIALTVLGGEPRRLARFIEHVLGAPARKRGRIRTGDVIRSAGSARTRWVGITAVIVLQAVIVVSHQLTPYVAILALLPLFLLGYFRPVWVAIAVVVLPVGFLIPNIGYVAQKFGAFSSFDPIANASTASVTQIQPSEASALQSHGVVLLTGVIVLLALAGFVRRILQGHVRQTLVIAWLAFCPVFTFFGQSYGGEGKFRVFLFGLPFYAMGVAWLFWSGRVFPRVRKLTFVVTTSVLLALFVSTYFQPEASLRVDRSDVVAAEWLDARFQGDDLAITVTDTFPLILAARYPEYLESYPGSVALTDIKNLSAVPIDNSDILQQIAQVDVKGHLWFAFSDAQAHVAIQGGYFTKTQLDSLEATVASVATLKYDRDGTRLYEANPIS